MNYGNRAPLAPKLFLKGPDSHRPLESYLATTLQGENKPELPPSELISLGAVYVNHKRRTCPNTLVGPADVIRVHINPRRYSLDPADLNTRIVFENENFVIVNKPCGLPMHPTLDNIHENLIAGFQGKYLLTHRLDVPTSGLVLLAKNTTYQTMFNNLVMNRKVHKGYHALVCLPQQTGTLVHFMKNDDRAPKKLQQTPDDPQWLECKMDILKCAPWGPYYSLEIKLHTGRTHQIRSQLAFEKNPIVGDGLYGGLENPFFGLHASRLSFTCPLTGKPMSFSNEASWPQ